MEAVNNSVRASCYCSGGGGGVWRKMLRLDTLLSVGPCMHGVAVNRGRRDGEVPS